MYFIAGIILSVTVVGQYWIGGGSAKPASAVGSVALIVVHRAARRVDRQLIHVHADAVTVSVGVGEQARLQHLVR
jgi:TRAP-type mannitol/chloroaromatic compound transport system permease large subunit